MTLGEFRARTKGLHDGVEIRTVDAQLEGTSATVLQVVWVVETGDGHRLFNTREECRAACPDVIPMPMCLVE